MKNNLKNTLLVLFAVLMAFVIFNACDTGLGTDTEQPAATEEPAPESPAAPEQPTEPEPVEDIEVMGIWLGDNSAYGVEDTKITITNDKIIFDNPDSWNHEVTGDVIEYDNDSFNLSDENPVSGDYGYLIYKVTSHPDPDYDETYSVVRWKAIETADGTTTMLYSECAYQLSTLAGAQAASDENAGYSSVTLAPIEVLGTWLGDNSSAGLEDSKLIITNNTITFDNPDAWTYDYAGDIVEYNNVSFNLSDENPASGDYGYLIYKVTSHVNSAYDDTYSVVRWMDIETVDGTTTMSYSEFASQIATLAEAQAASDESEWYSSVTLSSE